MQDLALRYPRVNKVHIGSSAGSTPLSFFGLSGAVLKSAHSTGHSFTSLGINLFAPFHDTDEAILRYHECIARFLLEAQQLRRLSIEGRINVDGLS